MKAVHKSGTAGVVCLLCAFALWHFRSPSIPNFAPPSAAAERGGRHELDQLLQQRYAAAKTLFDLEERRLREGATTLARVCEAARWVRDSALELPVSVPERLNAITNYVTLTRRLEEGVDRATQQGMAPTADLYSARYLRLDAEIALLRAGSAAQSR
jgi:hypothetical protein